MFEGIENHMTQFHPSQERRGAATDPLACAAPLLIVDNLTVTLPLKGEFDRQILSDISLSIAHGEVLGVLGESGAGKSTLGRALLRLLPLGFQFQRGNILLEGEPLLSITEEEMRSVRGDRISIAFQDSSVLNPVLRVQDQVFEVVRSHRTWTNSRCREEARAILEQMGLGEERLFSAYPHQLSGGQKQRVAIAQALVCAPQLLIADEPTASLDAATAREMISLIETFRRERNMAVLFISHQPEVLANIADRLIVLYCGQVVEEGPTQSVLSSPLHPYTRALLSCQAPIAGGSGSDHKKHWPFIPGSTTVDHSAPGCIFETRCSDRRDICLNVPPIVSITEGPRQVRCFEYWTEGA